MKNWTWTVFVCILFQNLIFNPVSYAAMLQFWLQAIACTCKVPGTFVPDLTESDVSEEYEKMFDEDQELQQLIDGHICFKVYPFSNGTILSFC